MELPIRFRALGFPVEVQGGFLALLGIYAVFMLADRAPLWSIASWCAVVFVSILVHELGHGLMMRRLEVPTGGLTLWMLGGLAHYGPRANPRPRERLLIAVSGPLAGFALALPVWLASPLYETSWVARVIAGQLLFVNVWWGVVNLLPMFPLDGGNALSSALQLRQGERSARRITAQVGMVTATLLGVFGGWLGDRFLVGFGLYLAFLNYQTYQQLTGRGWS